MAWFGSALSLDHFHICGHTAINCPRPAKKKLDLGFGGNVVVNINCYRPPIKLGKNDSVLATRQKWKTSTSFELKRKANSPLFSLRSKRSVANQLNPSQTGLIVIIIPTQGWLGRGGGGRGVASTCGPLSCSRARFLGLSRHSCFHV